MSVLKLKFSLCVMVFCSVLFTLSAAGNYLENSSFEIGAPNQMAESWNAYYCGYTRSNSKASDGSWSCKITGSGTAAELGKGGNRYVINNLPASGIFKISSDMYIESYTEGKIIACYATVNYTDNTYDCFERTLSNDEINDNLNCWKRYNLVFESNASKTISYITCWNLVWTVDNNKFIGTVYFDNLNLCGPKKALYWEARAITRSANPAETAQDILNRGFNYIGTDLYDEDLNCTQAKFLAKKGFKVIKQILPQFRFPFAPRAFSPYNEANLYADAKTLLHSMLVNTPEICGIVDDIEEQPFPVKQYTVDGEPGHHVFNDLNERIGTSPSQSTVFPVFKNWPSTNSHDVNDLNIENIEYNFPQISINHVPVLNESAILGYYGNGFSYKSYEMAAQTFTPGSSRITRIDIMLKRMGNSYPHSYLKYYLTETDAAGMPDLSRKITIEGGIIPREIDKSQTSSWSDIEPLSLYFDPVETGILDTNKKYALVIEFAKKNNDDWNDSFYHIGGVGSDTYPLGQAWRRENDSWVCYPAACDFWFKVYEPQPPQGFGLNQFHEDWIDFQCAVMARYVKEYRILLDTLPGSKSLWIYSGYKGVTYQRKLHNYDACTRRAYSVNWKMLSESGINYAMVGFGSMPISETRTALEQGNPAAPPKIIGVGGFPASTGEQTFINRYLNCDGVCLYYNSLTYDDDPKWLVPHDEL